VKADAPIDKRGVDDAPSVAALLPALEGTTFVEVRTWDDAQAVLRGKEFDVDNSFIQDDAVRGFLLDSVTFLSGREHFDRRRILSALFAGEFLAKLDADHLDPAVTRALEEASRVRRPDGRVEADLVELTREMMLDFMAAVIGLDGALGDRAAHERLRGYFEEIDAAGRARFMTSGAEDVIERGRASRELFLEEFFRPSWERRERLIAEGMTPPVDLITLILQHRDHYGMYDEHVGEHEATTFLIGSVGSTATAVCMTVADIEAWLETHPEDSVTDEGFLERAVAESLRYHTRVFTIRRALCDTVVPSGLAVSSGEFVWVNLRAADRSRYGADADEFDPNRLEPPGKAHPAGLAFGDGRHTCIAKWMVLGRPGDNRPGTVRTILERLYAAGVQSDPDHRLALRDSTREAVQSMPVVFTAL
jgi:cytochrome P450